MRLPYGYYAVFMCGWTCAPHLWRRYLATPLRFWTERDHNGIAWRGAGCFGFVVLWVRSDDVRLAA